MTNKNKIECVLFARTTDRNESDGAVVLLM